MKGSSVLFIAQARALMLSLFVALLTACTNSGGSADQSSKTPGSPSHNPPPPPEETVEKIIDQEIKELYVAMPQEYAFDKEELQLIETEILSLESSDLNKDEIAKLVQAEKENANLGGN